MLPVSSLDDAVGIDLVVQNGQPQSLTLLADRVYYINRVTLQAYALHFPAPDGMTWLATESDLASLDWQGLAGSSWVWRSEEDGTFSAMQLYQGARWQERAGFTLRWLDQAGTPLNDPLELRQENFLFTRLTAFSWAEEAPAVEDFGANSAAAQQLQVESTGTFTGPVDDIYTLSVAQGGPLDGTAKIEVRSLRGDDTAALPVFDGVSFPLGSAGWGAAVTFTSLAPGATLTREDRWIVRCRASGVVEEAAPGWHADFGAIANVLLREARSGAPTFRVPAGAATAELARVDGSGEKYLLPVTIVNQADADYGFEVGLEAAPPSNGSYYTPGEVVNLKVSLRDGQGQLLHAPDALPSYEAFTKGEAKGILYPTLAALDLPCTVFNDCRLNMLYVRLAGPEHLYTQRYNEPLPAGWLNKGVALPSTGQILAGLTDPSKWDAPLSNHVDIQLPEDIEPGTYLAVAKASRSWLGQTIYRAALLELQVGTTERQPWPTRVGGCQTCHVDDAPLSRLRHGVTQPRACALCHNAPHQTAGEVVHTIHFYAKGFPAGRNNCPVCHLDPNSNRRVSRGTCGACHGVIHAEKLEPDADPYRECGASCHQDPPQGHVNVPEP